MNIPLVISYAFTEQPGFSSVEFDDVKAACDITNHLIKNGHKKIAVIAGTKNNIHTERRLEGFKKAMQENALSVNEKDVVYGKWDAESGYQNAQTLLKGSDYSAIFCFNDLMAAGVYDYLYENKLVPGKDISVAGFDNRTMSQYLKQQQVQVQHLFLGFDFHINRLSHVRLYIANKYYKCHM